MATVQTVERQIYELEGFVVSIHFTGPGRERGRDVRSDRQDLPSYGYERRRPDNHTVAAWREGRFEAYYPGFTAVVFDGDGREVHGAMLLSTVRGTYE